MTDIVEALTRLIKLCPNISLSNKDIKQVIESESFNGCISKYKKKNPRNPIKRREFVPIRTEGIIEVFDEEKEVAEHIQECDDDKCECQGLHLAE